eukprot:g2533.t1
MLKEFNRSGFSNTNNTQKGAALPPCEGDRISSTVLQTKGSKGRLMERQEVLLDRLQPPEGALSADECNGLTELLWSSNVQPSLSWKQGFYFNEESSFRLGLIQRYGGPCGAIVAIQGHIVAELWAQRHSTESITPYFEFETNADRDEILMDGLTTVLLQAAGVPPIGDVSSRRRVSIVYSTRHNTEALEFDELLTYCCKRDIKPTRKEIKEYGWLLKLTDLFCQECLLQVLAQYKQEEGWGLVLFLLSILLTKTVHNIRDEMDDSEMCLIGNHSYCSQELVNLLITGKATTNTFDGNKSFDEEGSYLLKGIQRRSRLGLLTLLEWNNYVEVGSFLKCPEFPVWIVCAESHFTVLFCLDTILPKTDKGFELLHYDSLSLQAEPTRLQITRCPHGGLSKKLENQEMDASNVTCLEYVIQTKWNDAMVSIKN